VKRKVLGKGLSELIPELEEEVSLKELSEKKESFSEVVKFIPVEKILFSSLQPRVHFKEDASFEELVNSIREKGVLQPILVRELGEGLYECVAGERRLRACIKLGMEKIPAVIKKLSDEEVLLVALIENIQRKELNPVEEALGYKRLIEEFGYTQEEVAKRVGKDRSSVANLLRLLKLPREIQEDLTEGRLSVGHAKAILSLEKEEDQLFVRDQVIKRGLSVRETERLVKRLLSGGSLKRKEPDPDLVELSDYLSQLIGTKVKVEKGKKSTRFVIEFQSLNKAEEFLELLKKLYSQNLT
jgi:ParB family chromosome partitioning protein